MNEHDRLLPEVTPEMVEAAYDEFSANCIEFLNDSCAPEKKIIRQMIASALQVRSGFSHQA
jgi:hypothetical protein